MFGAGNERGEGWFLFLSGRQQAIGDAILLTKYPSVPPFLLFFDGK